jgi:hypothetical protein
MKTLGLLFLGVIALSVACIARDIRDWFETDEKGFKQPPGFRR